MGLGTGLTSFRRIAKHTPGGVEHNQDEHGNWSEGTAPSGMNLQGYNPPGSVTTANSATITGGLAIKYADPIGTVDQARTPNPRLRQKPDTHAYYERAQELQALPGYKVRGSPEEIEVDRLMSEARDLKTKWHEDLEDAITFGEIDPETAKEEYDYWSGGAGKWGELPPVVYHVTSAGTQVRAGGLLTRDEIMARDGATEGLGGGASDTISLTDSPEVAYDIHQAMLELHDVTTGKITYDDIENRARLGDISHFGDKESKIGEPFWDSFLGKKEALGEDIRNGTGRTRMSLPRTLEETTKTILENDPGATNIKPVGEAAGTSDKYYNFTFDRSPGAARFQVVDAFKSFLSAREYVGKGPTDPLFWGFDQDTSERYAQTPRSEIQLLTFNPIHEGVMGQKMGALNEWRVTTGEALRLVDEEQAAPVTKRLGISKHYGPGPHSGTMSPQSVHGGATGGGSGGKKLKKLSAGEYASDDGRFTARMVTGSRVDPNTHAASGTRYWKLTVDGKPAGGPRKKFSSLGEMESYISDLLTASKPAVNLAGIKQAWQDKTGSYFNEVSYVPVDQLTSYQEHDRTIDQPGYAKTSDRVNDLAADIKANGWNEPVMIEIRPIVGGTPTDYGTEGMADKKALARLIEGNHRLAAAKQLGMTHVPATVLAVDYHWSDYAMEATGVGQSPPKPIQLTGTMESAWRGSGYKAPHKILDMKDIIDPDTVISKHTPGGIDHDQNTHGDREGAGEGSGAFKGGHTMFEVVGSSTPEKRAADLQEATARLATGKPLYRGVSVVLPDDLKAKVLPLLDVAMEVEDMDNRFEAGKLILDHITENGIGRHWTTSNRWAGIAADRGGMGQQVGQWNVIIEIEPPDPSMLYPIQDSMGMAEEEVTLNPNGPYTYRSLVVQGGTWWDNENLLKTPITKHYGPGPHKSGSSQDAHGKKGSGTQGEVRPLGSIHPTTPLETQWQTLGYHDSFEFALERDFMVYGQKVTLRSTHGAHVELEEFPPDMAAAIKSVPEAIWEAAKHPKLVVVTDDIALAHAMSPSGEEMIDGSGLYIHDSEQTTYRFTPDGDHVVYISTLDDSVARWRMKTDGSFEPPEWKKHTAEALKGNLIHELGHAVTMPELEGYDDPVKRARSYTVDKYTETLIQGTKKYSRDELMGHFSGEKPIVDPWMYPKTAGGVKSRELVAEAFMYMSTGNRATVDAADRIVDATTYKFKIDMTDWLDGLFPGGEVPIAKRAPTGFTGTCGVTRLPVQFAKHTPGGVDHDQKTHGRRGSGGNAGPTGDDEYRGQHQPNAEYGAPAHDLSVIVNEDIYEHPEWYFSMIEPYNREGARIIQRLRGNPEAEIEVYRAVPTGVKAINDGDWVTSVRSYATVHGDASLQDWESTPIGDKYTSTDYEYKRIGPGYEILSRTVKAKELVWPADSLVEFGWFPNGPFAKNPDFTLEDIEDIDIEKFQKHYPGAIS